MKITEKEELLIKDGKLHAVIRKVKPEEKVGEIIFEVDGKPYRLSDRKKWKVFRIGAQRSHIDFSCDTIYEFKILITELYESYDKIKDTTVYLLIFKADKSQMTLGV